jgi:hypothetical protein
MDSVSLRSELDGAVYQRVRFVSLSAKHLQKNSGKGRLVVNAEIGLRSAEGSDLKEGEHRYVSTVEMTLYGVPAGLSNNGDAISAAAFKIEAEVQAIVVWKDEPSEELKNSQECAAHIARPLFMLGATEIRALASKLGFSGLNFEIDLHQVLQSKHTNVTQELEPAKVEPAPKKKTAKKVRASKG